MVWKLAGSILLGTFVCAAVQVPAGTNIQVRLSTKLASDSSKAKDSVQAVVIAPVMLNGQVLIGTGAKLHGEVTDVKAARKANDQAALGLNFTEIAPPDGKPVRIKTRIAAVDNARETVDQSGKIAGIMASESISGRLDQGIGKIAQRNPGFAEVLEIAKASVLNQSNGEIRYEPGVEMTLEVTAPFEWTSKATGQRLPPVSNESALYRLVNAEPYQTYAENPPKPSDITNLMFIGSQQQLESAFKNAGWDTAAALDNRSAMETFRAIAELRGYKEAPVSVLLLEGRTPDLVFQKQNNTFARRHHLRIWRRPERFDGQPVWVCSSTHDIGIAFSDENHTFIHKIDPWIDKERAKVVSDLLYAGGVKSLAIVERSAVPTNSSNATGDALETDGRMAVVILK